MRRAILLLTATAATLLVAGGVAFAVTKVGGPGDDTLYGTDNTDKLYGRGGDDTIYGRGGNDRSPGFRGQPYLVGNAGDDTIYGGTGQDEVSGDLGADALYAGEGLDLMTGGRGADALYGDGGSDLLVAGPRREGALDILYGGSVQDALISRNRPADKDVVYCGRGRDFAYADRKDVLYGCERVNRG
jgi:Ca2+-binding RTX toxin-like protein